MARVKTKVSKNKNKAVGAATDEVVEETETASVESFPIKKKGDTIVIDEHVEIGEVVEEKPEEDTAVKAEEAEDLLGEELGLDDEELNPFGDKWEE